MAGAGTRIVSGLPVTMSAPKAGFGVVSSAVIWAAPVTDARARVPVTATSMAALPAHCGPAWKRSFSP